MKYGCIGERLGHSFSKEIHNALASYEYELCEIAKNDLDAFMKERNFNAINVTIPYKEAVIPYLAEIDRNAKAIGAVNTIVNRDGKLYGYNTDYWGMSELIKKMCLSLKGKKVAILGTGGTSKTAFAVAEDMGAKSILKISRSEKDSSLTYEELYLSHSDTDIVINTTPSGMYPNVDGLPIELDKLPNISGVVDAVYNPLNTRLIIEAKKRGINAEGGLYMLVAQAVRASEIFLDTKYPAQTTEKVYQKILSSKQNIVLIGMPGCGKTTVGKILAEKLSRPLVDTDELIIEETGKNISNIFEESGEIGFRDIEQRVIKEKVLSLSSSVIATGGGAVIREENIDALKQNGVLFFIDRPLEQLLPTSDRPLANTAEAIKKRYEERYPIYCRTCDKKINLGTSAEDTANKIIKELTL
ncbi:MAG: AAA family ATPase [Clostridia bacterium]|nr:AAA family ATPase [Clostridia bacterium]